jgi:hypothetical protein
MRLGIALSGGGIRSAAFNLGALQALRERNVLEHADYLAAVSGGNYVASALTISGAYQRPEHDNGRPQWAHCSVEERYLRRHTDYLAPGLAGRVWLGLNVVYGFALNYLPFLLCAFVAGRVAGWGLHAVLSRLGRSDPREGPLAMPGMASPWLLASAMSSLVLAVLLVGYRRMKDGHRRPADFGESTTEGVALRLVGLAAAASGTVVLPALARAYGTASEFVLAHVLRRPSARFDTTVDRVTVAIFWLVGSLVLAAVALALSRRFRARGLMLVLASLATAGLLLVPLLSSLEYSTAYGLRDGGDLLPVVLALVVVLFMALAVHNRRYSLHHFYRERLNGAFALVRTRRGDSVVAEPICFDEPLYFSDIGGRLQACGSRLPKLIVCCAVNLTSDEVPVGRFAESFTFEHDHSGGRLFGYHETTRFEAPDGMPGTRLTLPSIMAVSGAALSPLMGRFTHPPLRFLMAMTNVRLGVWIRNPLHADWAAETGGGPADEPPNLARRVRRRIVRGWREPGALYVLREALGRTRSSHRFIYLTDGGHWENLGLVELLRRRCTHVLCFDASTDQAGGGLDIGRAVALARSELGVQIDLDPRPTMPSKGFSEDVAVRGSIRYPASALTARLVYAKAVLTRTAGWDLLAYRARDGRFPNHSTGRQMFTDEQFESYRALGYDAGLRALELLNVPDVLLQDPAPGGGTTSEGAAGNGRPPAHSAGHGGGRARDGTGSDGTGSDGAASDGPGSDSPGSDSPASDSPGSDGTALDGVGRSSTARTTHPMPTASNGRGT